MSRNMTKATAETESQPAPQRPPGPPKIHATQASVERVGHRSKDITVALQGTQTISQALETRW